LDFQVPMQQINYIACITVIVLLLSLTLVWSIRNKVWQGKRAIKRYLLTLNLRKEMLDANFQDERYVTERVSRIPKIKIEFDTKEMNSGKLMIRNSVEFHDRLSNATFTPALTGYIVESIYQS